MVRFVTYRAVSTRAIKMSWKTVVLPRTAPIEMSTAAAATSASTNLETNRTLY